MTVATPKDQGPGTVGAGAPQGAGASQGAGQGSGNQPPLSGDKALLAVMLMQLYELTCLSKSADSESGLSVALRTSMQNTMTERLEEFQKLLSFCAANESKSGFGNIWAWASANKDNPTWQSLVSKFPNAGLDSVPSSMRDDFASYLSKNIAGNTDGAVSEFRNNVGTIGTQLQQYGTFQEQCKNLADGFQNGAGSLAQSITQFLAQLSSEGSLVGDVVAQ